MVVAAATAVPGEMIAAAEAEMPICPDCLLSELPDDSPEARICGRCRHRRSRWHPPGFTRREQQAAYYALFNQHEPFRRALADLSRGLGPLLPLEEAPPRKAVVQLQAFVRRWALPGDHGPLDVWRSLIAGPPGQPDVLREVRRIPFEWTPIAKIIPRTPEPIFFHPNVHGRAAIGQIVREATSEFQRTLTEQIEAFLNEAEEAGWHRTPVPYRSRAEIRRMAHRLFQRAVLKMSWAEIQEVLPEMVDIRTIRSSVHEWARVLHVDLPPGTPGRPRRGIR